MTQPSRQSDASLEDNVGFFRDHIDQYVSSVRQLDTYSNIRAFADDALKGIDRLLDIGNGGTFDYDPTLVREIVAVDLFLEQLPADRFPPNVVPKSGSALDLGEKSDSYDGVFMCMLIHHLVGETVEESLRNIERAIAEAYRVLKPGGRLIIIESCVPHWFYAFERVVFRPTAVLIRRVIDHPATLQFPPDLIEGLLRKHSASVRTEEIPKGRWVIQYGFKFPAALTPVAPHRFIVQK